jgi:hypothetical protein
VVKLAFVIFAQGETARTKVRRICEAFGANLYPCPEVDVARKELMEQVTQRMNDLTAVRPMLCDMLSECKRRRESDRVRGMLSIQIAWCVCAQPFLWLCRCTRPILTPLPLFALFLIRVNGWPGGAAR